MSAVRDEVHELATCPQVATIVMMMTVWAGVGMSLDWIPDDIGKLAALVGIVLSLVLICSHLQNVKKLKLEIELLKRKRDGEDPAAPPSARAQEKIK